MLSTGLVRVAPFGVQLPMPLEWWISDLRFGRAVIHQRRTWTVVGGHHGGTQRGQEMVRNQLDFMSCSIRSLAEAEAFAKKWPLANDQVPM